MAPLTKALLDGKMISGPVNVNSRLLKKRWIEKLAFTPEILVLGSSHTLSATKNIFPGRSFFNASVSNCTFQDMYAFLNLFEKKGNGQLPSVVFICADQWLWGHSFTESQWLVNRSDAIDLAHKAGVASSGKFPPKWKLQKEWIKELFSVRYLIRSVKTRGNTERFEICQSIDKEKMMFLPDGSRNIPESVLNTSDRDVLAKAESYFYSGKDEHFRDVDMSQCELFEKMIAYLEKKNRKVILYVPSYHPETYKLLKQSSGSEGIFKAESYLQTFAQKHHIAIMGCTDPARVGLLPSDFYDAVHLKPEILNRILENNLKSILYR